MKFSRKNNSLLIGLFTGITFYSICSCSNDTSISEVGEDWIDSNTSVYFIDTLSVRSSTFKFDSLSVSGSDRLLIGAYTNEEFGYTESKVFAAFSPSSYSLDSEAELDSVALILNYDGYVYNDSLQNQVFKVYEILEEVENDGNDFYNTSTFQIAQTTIGTKTFRPYPTLDDSLHIA